MASIVTEFVGPRPGCYIMRFCQGATEMVARFVVLVVSVGVLIVSAVSLGLIGLLPSFTGQDSRAIEETTGLNSATLFFNSLSAGGVGVGVAVLIIIWEIVMIILRFLNIGILNLKVKIFLGIDIAVALILAIVVNISGILGAYMASEWSKVNPALSMQEDMESVAAVIRSQIALAAIALLDGLLIALLATWIIIFILRKWNEEVIKETAKDVI